MKKLALAFGVVAAAGLFALTGPDWLPGETIDQQSCVETNTCP
ncbi:MAG: hypothetical protein ACFB6S_17495 [Geminicoccaceae bacterium]